MSMIFLTSRPPFLVVFVCKQKRKEDRMKSLKIISVLAGILITTGANAVYTQSTCTKAGYYWCSSKNCCTINSSNCDRTGVSQCLDQELGEIGESCNKGEYYAGNACKLCPTPGTSDGVTNVLLDQSDITICYIPRGTAFSDSYGSGEYTANCYHDGLMLNPII